MPSSIAWPAASRKTARTARRGAGTPPSKRDASRSSVFPDTRTTPIPALPDAVATAAITSLSEGPAMLASRRYCLPAIGQHLSAFEEHPVERNENRNLHENWQATSKRVDLLGLVHIHHRLVQLRFVICILLAELHQPRRYQLHFGHRAVARGRQREENQFDDHGEQDDRQAPVAEPAVEELQHPEKGLCDH